MRFSKKFVVLCVAVILTVSLGVMYSQAIASSTNKKRGGNIMCLQNPTMKLYIDTHDKRDGTFPDPITAEQLNAFYAGYAKACAEEGVVIVRTYISTSDGKAYCLNMAPSKEAVKRAHKKAGLPYSSISEVHGVAPTDLLLNQ